MIPDPATCYRALSSRDRRFDGVFFVGVTTTGIYCRPVCPARLAGRDRCQFFSTAGAAEGNGFRPCLRCRPERAPGRSTVDATRTLAGRAAARIEAGAMNEGGVESLARALHVGPRQLRRAVKGEFGVTPVQLAQTHRLLLAKRLLTETDLAVTRVAYASGFSSLRRFNALFRERYRLSPTELRGGRQPLSESPPSASPVTPPATFDLTLDFRPPYDWEALLGFLTARAIDGVEQVDGHRYRRTMCIGENRGWIAVEPKGSQALCVELSLSLLPVLMPVLSRIRSLFDLDAEPTVIAGHLGADERLAPLVRRRPGLRVPGAGDAFEIAWRAVLGQQVSVAAARTLAGRLVAALGEGQGRRQREAEAADQTLPDGLSHFPLRPERVAEVDPARIGELGITGSRAECIVKLAREVALGNVVLEPGTDVTEALEALEKIRGIGPWTARYIALRALHWPDAFPEGDLGLLNALGARFPRELKAASERWRPWRAYATLHLWQSLADGTSPGERPIPTAEMEAP